MSGATIGGVVGAVVGSFIPGVGTQLGWMIGSAIGGYVDPEQISQFGPRLTDASQQTARDGVPIPYGYGTFPCKGNIIWYSDITEHANESTDDGKGSGQEVTTTTYTYTRSYAIGICQGEIAGLLQIKRNGKVVWDTRTDDEFEFIFNPDGVDSLWDVVRQYIAQARAFTSRFSTKLAIYTGSNTQTADPTMEAHFGVGNVTAYRGLAYIVVTDDDVTELRGAVPQYEFVVRVSGTASETCNEENLVAHWPLNDAARNGVSEELIGGWSGVYSDTDGVGTGPALVAGGGSSFFMETINDYMVYTYDDNPGYPGVRSGDGWTMTLWARPTDIDGGSVIKNIATYWQSVVGAGREWAFHLDGTDNMVPQGSLYEGGGVIAINATNAAVAGETLFLALRWEADSPSSASGTLSLVVNGVQVGTATCEKPTGQGEWMAVGGYGVPSSTGFIGYVQAIKQYDTALTDAEILDRYRPASQYTELPDAPGVYVNAQGEIYNTNCVNTVSAGTVLLSDIVATEFQRVGLTSDDYDVSDLEGIPVLGYRVLPNGSGVDASLGPLMQAYFFDIAEWDGKLRCVLRGGASSLSLTLDDLAERDGEAVEWTRVQEAELLRLQTVAYIDPAAGYSATTQKWERRAGTVQAKGEAAVEVPITATANFMAGVAKKRGSLPWAETEKAKLSLPYKFAKVTPTDILTLDDGSESHRLRVGQIEDDSGVRLLELTKERGDVYATTATGTTPGTPTVPGGGGLIGPTFAHYMNLPRLRTGDNQPGAYVAATGVLPSWKGADIYISADGGVSYQFAYRTLSRATIGVMTADCTASSEPITATLHDGRTLSSITTDQLAARQNGFAIVTGGTAEVGQFQTATENSDGDWELTDTLRGQLGTTAAAHSIGDAFALLDQAVQFMPLDISLAGKTLLLKAVSLGTSLDDTEAQEFFFDPQFTGPETIEYYTNASSEKYTDADGSYYYRE